MAAFIVRSHRNYLCRNSHPHTLLLLFTSLQVPIQTRFSFQTSLPLVLSVCWLRTKEVKKRKISTSATNTYPHTTKIPTAFSVPQRLRWSVCRRARLVFAAKRDLVLSRTVHDAPFEL